MGSDSKMIKSGSTFDAIEIETNPILQQCIATYSGSYWGDNNITYLLDNTWKRHCITLEVLFILLVLGAFGDRARDWADAAAKSSSLRQIQRVGAHKSGLNE